MKTNFVLVDFENVQPSGLEALNGHEVKVLVFVGANQTKVPFELAESLQALGERAEYVKIAGNDFLIKHLRDRKIRVYRFAQLGEMPFLRIPNAKPNDEKITAIVRNLVSRGQTRPRKTTTLASTINSLFEKKLEVEELNRLIQSLQSRGLVSVSDGKVTYHLPPNEP